MGKDLKGKELGEGIYQRKDSGRYCGRFTDRFGNRKTVYGDKLLDVKDALIRMQYENNMKLNIVDSEMILDDWYKKWMNAYKRKVRDSTKLIYDGIYRKYISPKLGSRKLCDVTQLQVTELINSVRVMFGVGFETQNKMRILLVDMFNKAMINDFIRKNPAKGIKLVRDEDEDNGRDVQVLTEEEQVLFFDCCKGTFYDNLFTVAFWTGLRMGEICALTESDIDWNRMVIKVNKTLLYQKLEGDTQKAFHIHPPKTKTSRREIPITKQCEIALKKQIIQKAVISAKSINKALPGFEDLLFTTKFNTPICCQIFNDAIQKICDEVNLVRDELEQITFSSHCFRHTFATRAIEKGMQPRTLQEILGHATLQMTMDLYVKVLDDHKKAEMQKFEEIFDETMVVADSFAEQRYNQMIAKQQKKAKVIKYKEVAQ